MITTNMNSLKILWQHIGAILPYHARILLRSLPANDQPNASAVNWRWYMYRTGIHAFSGTVTRTTDLLRIHLLKEKMKLFYWLPNWVWKSFGMRSDTKITRKGMKWRWHSGEKKRLEKGIKNLVPETLSILVTSGSIMMRKFFRNLRCADRQSRLLPKNLLLLNRNTLPYMINF